MKTTILFCIALVMSLSVTFAGNNSVIKPKSDVVKYISKMVKYPSQFTDSKKSGSVYVSFKVDRNGNVLVDKMNSTDSELQSYVAGELAKIKVNTSKLKIEDYDQSYVVKLKFQVAD